MRPTTTARTIAARPDGHDFGAESVHPRRSENLEDSMTISRRRLAAAAFMGSGVAALAHTPAFAQNTDASAVADAVINLTKAMLSADKAKLEQYVTDQLSYGHSSGLVQ